jgi:hypothetical protein
MELTPEIAGAMVDYLETTLPLIEKQAEVASTVKEEAPRVVDFLIKRGFVSEGRREAAIKAALDHKQVLAALQKTAERSTPQKVADGEEPPRLGGPAGEGQDREKQASLTPSFARNPRMEEADRKFLAVLGF